MVDPVGYKVIDQPWSPSDPDVIETTLNGLGQEGWRLTAFYVDPMRERTRLVLNQGPAASGGAAGIPEAPADGVQYGRQDAAWTPVPPVTPPGPATAFQEIVLGFVKGVDYNVVGDTPIPIAAGVVRYVPTRGVSVNNIGGGDIASIAVLTAPGGDDVGLEFYTQEGVMGSWPVSGGIPVRTGNTLYLHVATAEGVPATGDIYILGYDLTGA